MARRALVAASGVVLAAGCARPALPSGQSPAAATTDTVWYVSARDGASRRDSATSATLAYGFVVFARPLGSNAPGGTLPSRLVDSVRLTDKAFLGALRNRIDATPSPDDYAVVYVHGFGTSTREAWTHTVAARHRAGARAPWIVFSWPSRGSGISPPRRGAFLTGAYQDDSAAAAASIPSFVVTIRQLLGATGAERTILVSHSLGGQLLGEGLVADDSLRGALRASPVRAVAFVAPDVEAGRFADSLVPALRPLTQRLVLYASRSDRVLGLSRRIHGTERAGRLGRSPIVRDGLETIDASHARNEGWFQRAFGTHHAFRRAEGVLFDLGFVVGPHRAPDCRLALGSASRSADGVWRLSRSRPSLDRIDDPSCVPPPTTSLR